MKTILNLKQCLILFAAVFSLTSCLKSDDPDFQIYPGGYLEQSVTEIDGETPTITSKYTPIILVQSVNNDVIQSCTVSGPSTVMMDAVNGYNGLVWLSTMPVPTSELPKSAYSIKASNTKGEEVTTSISFSSITTVMENELISPINYSGKKLTFSFNKVKNATAYILLSSPSRNASFFQSSVLQVYTESQISAGELSLEEASFASKLQAGTHYITTAAIIGSVSNNNINGLSVLQRGETTTYTKQE